MEHLRQFYALTNDRSVIRKVGENAIRIALITCFFFLDLSQRIGVNGAKQIPFQRLNDRHIPTNDTVMRMNSIFQRLSHHDSLLHRKLEEFKIEPTVYGM